MSEEKNIDSEIDKISVEMMEYARYAEPTYYGQDKEEKRNKYYKLQHEYSELRDELNIMFDKEAEKRKNELNKSKNELSNKIFINGYGEATKREITCSTYIKSQNKIQKQIVSFLGDMR